MVNLGAAGDIAAFVRVAAECGLTVERDVSLASFTTYKLGGPAGALLTLDTRDELLTALRVAAENGVCPSLVVGNGSNLLVGDGGVPGLVVHLRGDFAVLDFLPVSAVEPGVAVVRAGASVLLPVLTRQCAARGLVGLEWCVGIPGTVGGAVVMNAGGHGSQTADWLVAAEIADFATGSVGWRPAADLGFAYRHSNLTPSELVVAAEYRVTDGDAESALAELANIVRWRRENQPGGANAGSVFTNPVGDSAGRLIESCGLKGVRVGGAVVSPKHANFIQAEPGATAKDVVELIELVRERVARERGVSLVPEVRCVGIFD